MAILTTEQLVTLRQNFEREGDNGPWLKADLNDAFQAIEDWWESNQGSRNGAITAATAPGRIPVGIMQQLGKHWQQHKHGQGG